MKKYLQLLFIPFFSFCGQQTETKKGNTDLETVVESSKTEQNATYYLIRHAEKVRTDQKNQDPHLDAKGMLRAQRWAKYFETIEIDKIYCTKYIRTEQTISKVAQQKKISPIIYDPNTVFSEAFLKETNNKSILIAGHSNTIPQLVNRLIGEEKYLDMEDSDNSTLFKVTINGESKKVETITVE